MPVEYTDPGIGRLQIAVVGLKEGETMHTQAFPGTHGNLFKSAICQEYYRDCDISNCHPVLGVLLHDADTLLSGGGDCGCDEQHGDGARCTATTSKGTRCRNRSTNFGDSTLCWVHTQKKMGESEMADIRAYRANTAAATGPGMYRDASNQLRPVPAAQVALCR